MADDLIEHDLSVEEWREYDLPGRAAPYRIDKPGKLVTRKGGTTHRIVDAAGVTHCLPAPGVAGCVLRWKGKSEPVSF